MPYQYRCRCGFWLVVQKRVSFMHFGAQVLTNQTSVVLRHQNGIFFGTNGINTRRETAVLTENRILSCFLSQFNVLSPRFAVQLFSPSLLLLSLAVSCTKGKNKNKKRLKCFHYWRLLSLNQDKKKSNWTPRQAKRVADSFYLSIYWQIPSGHSNVYESTAKLFKVIPE